LATGLSAFDHYPTGGVTFGSVAVNWDMRQSGRPLVSTRGHLVDHFALSVANLGAWIAKLRGEGVRILDGPYKLGGVRAVLVEGSGREALELVEAGRCPGFIWACHLALSPARSTSSPRR
jgi:hypothetical protein